MERYRISAVSYLNTIPFLFGIEKSALRSKNVEVQVDYPSHCAYRLKTNDADIGLIPVAALDDLSYYEIISDYCIGAESTVKSVALFSKKPIRQINNIVLDYQSRTSIELVKILAKHYWKQNFTWIKAEKGYEDEIHGDTAAVIIGDRAFNYMPRYEYSYDLSEAWYNFSGLPFVFAVWAANKNIDSAFKNKFNEAMKFGTNNIAEAVNEYQTKHSYQNVDLYQYLTQNISYKFDKAKKEALQLFSKLRKNE